MKKAYILRTCGANLQSYGGFQWPEKGRVEAPDWNPEPKCGSGLHGFLNGEGGGALADWSGDAKWIVAWTDASKVVDLEGKVKFPWAEVVFVGDRKSATDFLKRKVKSSVVIGGFNMGGHNSTNTGGYGSTNTGGEYSTNTGGDDSTNTGGNCSTNMGGNCSTNTGRRGSTNTGKNYSTNTGGDDSINTGGYRSTNTGGEYSTNTGGDDSTNTGGDYSTNTGGRGSTNTGGENSSLTWKVWDGDRYRLYTFYVGEGGVLPNTPYFFEDGKIKPLGKSC